MTQDSIDTPSREISAEFPFESKYIEVDGSRMHYVEQGEGDPILFLHGNPTSTYLWRNVIPHLTSQGRCIAVDLIGMGKSDKPDIGYRFVDHYRYVAGFIEKMGLKNITLVVHDWGSGLGFHYAHEHSDNIRAIAFMEAVYKPMTWKGVAFGLKVAFKMMRAPFVGWMMVSVGNMFLKKMIPDMTIRKLSGEELRQYKSPYPSVGSRKPVRVWPQEIPFDGKPADVHRIVDGYSQWLQETQLPKLLMTFDPGVIIKAEEARWIAANFPNLTEVHIGNGLHYVQEDRPHEIGEAIADWHSQLSQE